jgi:hypothetical protein
MQQPLVKEGVNVQKPAGKGRDGVRAETRAVASGNYVNNSSEVPENGILLMREAVGRYWCLPRTWDPVVQVDSWQEMMKWNIFPRLGRGRQG